MAPDVCTSVPKSPRPPFSLSCRMVSWRSTLRDGIGRKSKPELRKQASYVAGPGSRSGAVGCDDTVGATTYTSRSAMMIAARNTRSSEQHGQRETAATN